MQTKEDELRDSLVQVIVRIEEINKESVGMIQELSETLAKFEEIYIALYAKTKKEIHTGDCPKNPQIRQIWGFSLTFWLCNTEIWV